MFYDCGMHRFFVSQSDEVNGDFVVIKDPETVHQFTKVLKFKANEVVALLDNSGSEFVCEIAMIGGRQVELKVMEKKILKNVLPVKFVLAQAILKNSERFEWILQKGTELNVDGFLPLVTDRTERKVLGKLERFKRILKEAAE